MMKSGFLRSSFFLFVLAGTLATGGALSGRAAPQAGGQGAAEKELLRERPLSPSDTISIPGPLRSFLRMAAISQQVPDEDVLPLLARNIVMEGYQYWRDGKSRKPTEYLILLKAYLEQARDLRQLAGSDGVIRVSDCPQSERLLTVLGYRFREGCSSNTAAVTEDPKRAFLTVDSAFPLVNFEEAVRKGQPFSYPYPFSTVPVLFGTDVWSENGEDVLGALMDDPQLARLYWAMWHLDRETQAALRQSPGIKSLIPLSASLDFYGHHVYIRSGRVVVPGGIAAESAWKDLAGASPSSPGEFVVGLMGKDEGWLAAYYDALARLNRAQQAYFTEPRRLRRFYQALRGKGKFQTSASRPVFRPGPNLFLLTTRLLVNPDGQPHVPGNLPVWKEIFRRKSDSKLVREVAKRANGWDKPEELLEGMFALTPSPATGDPLRVYLALTEIDRRRTPEQRLSPQTVRLLAEQFSRLGDQYYLFTEWPSLDNDAIVRFFAVVNTIDRISDRTARANAAGLFQASIGLWQILARQGQIPEGMISGSFQRVVHPFVEADSSEVLYEAARSSLRELFVSVGAGTEVSQAGLINLLAGPPTSDPEGERVQQELAARMQSVLDAQRLVSFDTLLQLGDGLQQFAQGQQASQSLLRLAGQLREFEMPQPLFSRRERSEWASGLNNNRHLSMQMKTDLSKVFSKTSNSRGDLEEARGLLTPFLRDTLVGINYAYYEPPGAQMLHNNSLFVRSHDFSGQMTPGSRNDVWQTPRLFGRGWTASGGGHLAGSLADLPYVLSQMEQDFMIPENVQALIWSDLVPGLLTSSIVPRWWQVTPNELRAVTLYQRFGEELVAAAAQDKGIRQKAIDILWDRMMPRRQEQVRRALESGSAEAALDQLMPAETFYLAAEFRRRFADESERWGKAGQDLEALRQQVPEETSWERISQDFGVPHPTLANTYARELMTVKPMPTFLGYSSRLLAESWESSNLYWARLADEKGLSPAALHHLVPQLTQKMVQKIFATHLEDWHAVLRALRETGEEFRGESVAAAPAPAGPTGL